MKIIFGCSSSLLHATSYEIKVLNIESVCLRITYKGVTFYNVGCKLPPPLKKQLVFKWNLCRSILSSYFELIMHKSLVLPWLSPVVLTGSSNVIFFIIIDTFGSLSTTSQFSTSVCLHCLGLWAAEEESLHVEPRWFITDKQTITARLLSLKRSSNKTQTGHSSPARVSLLNWKTFTKSLTRPWKAGWLIIITLSCLFELFLLFDSSLDDVWVCTDIKHFKTPAIS